MTAPKPNSVTQLLAAAGRGDAAATNKLWSALYDELRRLARCQLAHEAPGRTLDSASLVHEAFQRMIGGEPIEWANRRHFFGAAANAMRRIRVDDARKRGRLKRGGAGQHPGPLNVEPPIFDDDPAELIAIDEALQNLKKTFPRGAEVVMLRYFAGFSIDEAAATLNVSARTVDTDWRFAKAWLHRELSKGDSTCCGRAGSDDA